MINYKKRILIKKHLGVNTPDWVVDNCVGLLSEFEYLILIEYDPNKDDVLKDFKPIDIVNPLDSFKIQNT